LKNWSSTRTITPDCQRTLATSGFTARKEASDNLWLQHSVCIIPNKFYNCIVDHRYIGFYKLPGRIPWGDIADNLSHHLSNRSQVYSDHKLEDPSYMKSDAVDVWLWHWLKLQKRDKCPLVSKGTADKISDPRSTKANVSKRKGKKGKGRYIDSNDTEGEVRSDYSGMDRDESTTSDPQTGQGNEAGADAMVLPPSPNSAAYNRKTRCTFLASLSTDTNYKKLMLLLYAAKVSEQALPPASADYYPGR
jgi:hypothetical protein